MRTRTRLATALTAAAILFPAAAGTAQDAGHEHGG
jgi:hypothetical protein